MSSKKYTIPIEIKFTPCIIHQKNSFKTNLPISKNSQQYSIALLQPKQIVQLKKIPKYELVTHSNLNPKPPLTLKSPDKCQKTALQKSNLCLLDFSSSSLVELPQVVVWEDESWMNEEVPGLN